MLLLLAPACSILQPPGEQAAPPDLTFEHLRLEQYKEGVLSARGRFDELEYRRALGHVEGKGVLIKPVDGSLAGATITAGESAGDVKHGSAVLAGGVVYASVDGDRAETQACDVDLVHHQVSGELPIDISGAGYRTNAARFTSRFSSPSELNLLGETRSVIASDETRPSSALDITADSLTIQPGTRIALARGHVVARGSTFEAHCDTGETIYGPAQGSRKRTVQSMHLVGHVHLRRLSDGLIADANEGTYDASTSLVVLTGDPVVTRGADVMHGNRIDVGTEDETVIVQEPRVELPRQGSTPVAVRAELLTMLDNGHHMRFERNVQLHEGTFTARAERMDAFTRETQAGQSEIERLVMLGHVDARRGNEHATAGRAVYDVARTDLILEDNPVLVQSGNELRGTRITLNNTTGRATATQADVNLRSTDEP